MTIKIGDRVRVKYVGALSVGLGTRQRKGAEGVVVDLNDNRMWPIRVDFGDGSDVFRDYELEVIVGHA